MVTTGQIVQYAADGEPWQRLPDEPMRWYARFNGYLLLGPSRTIRRAARKSGEVTNEGYSSWCNAARAWCWEDRAEAYDVYEIEESRAKRADALQKGLALDYERVISLKSLAQAEISAAEVLIDRIVSDPDALNSGLSRRYEVVKGSLDRTLEALAAETGGRVKRVSVQRDLQDYAVALAREQGYDESVARDIAKLVAAESKG